MKKLISFILLVVIILSTVITATAIDNVEQSTIVIDNKGVVLTEEKILTKIDINDEFGA